MNITILGTGAFGLALSITFHEKKNYICMWTKFENEKNLLEKERCYEKVLPSIQLPNAISFTTDMEEAIEKADIIVFAIPACFIEETIEKVKKYYKKEQHLVITSKGMDTTSLLFLDEIIKKQIETDKIAVLSGPTFAIDMANKYPVALSLASFNKETEKIVKSTLENTTLKIEPVKDVLAIEICGAIKNVMAIGSGIIRGMDLPVSTQSMYLTEALHDMIELLKGLNADWKVVLSYAGIGDLFLTCTSEKSRNFQLGYLIGRGASLKEIEDFQKETTVEGAYTLEAFHKLIEEKEIDLPVIQLLYDILFHQKGKELFYEYLKGGK